MQKETIEEFDKIKAEVTSIFEHNNTIKIPLTELHLLTAYKSF